MIFSDVLSMSKKTIINNKRDWIQIILFAFTTLLILISLTAYFTYKRFLKITLEDGIDAHEISFNLYDENTQEMINSISKINGITDVRLYYEVFTTASVNSSSLDIYSIPNNVNFVNEKLKKIQVGEMIINKNLELKIDGKKYKGKQLIGKNVSITKGGNHVTDVKITDAIDCDLYGVPFTSAFISNEDILKIADVRKASLDKNTSIDGNFIASINYDANRETILNEIKDLGIDAEYIIKADPSKISEIFNNIFLIFIFSIFSFFVVKFLYLNNYFNKEKNNIMINLTCCYSYKEISKIYILKNILCSILSILVSIILYFIALVMYAKFKSLLISQGLIPYLTIHMFILVYIIEIIINIIITLFYFHKIKKIEVSEFIRYD